MRHSLLTAQHQIHDGTLTYTDEAELFAANPGSSYYHRIGYATSEGSYWMWTAGGWVPHGNVLARALVHDGDVLTHEGEILWA